MAGISDEAGAAVLDEAGQDILDETVPVFTPSGTTELPYTSVQRPADDTMLANDVQITRAGGTLQEARDQASIAEYLFPRTYSRTDILLEDDASALAFAQWVLYVAKDTEDRFDQLTVNPLRDAADLWPQVLGREIGDRIQVWRRPPGSTTVIRDVFIRGMQHDFDASSQTWTTTWTLQDATRYTGFLLLDSAATGILDSDKLAF